jgi:hypothetical protein
MASRNPDNRRARSGSRTGQSSRPLDEDLSAAPLGAHWDVRLDGPTFDEDAVLESGPGTDGGDEVGCTPRLASWMR